MMSTPLQPIVQAKDLTISYDNSPDILSNISFDINYGDFIGVIGPNGGGKTTLMKAILGLLPPRLGSITYYDREGAPTHNSVIGYVPQQNLIDKAFPITVQEIVAYGLLSPNSTKINTSHYQKIDEVLRQVDMHKDKNTPIGRLSGGQLQRVLLARAIVSDPDLLILDEPNTYVDKHFESQLYELLPLINKRSSIIIVSHDIGSISKMVNRLFCVNRHLHIHENIQNVCEDCSESAHLNYISLLDHR